MRLRTIAVMAIMAVSVTAAQADLVVDFGADYVSGGNQTLSPGANDIGGPSGQFSIAYSSSPFVIEDLEGAFPFDAISYYGDQDDHNAAVWWASESSWTYDGMGDDDVLFTIGNYIMSIDDVYFFVKDDGTYYRSPLADPDANINVDPADPKEYTRGLLGASDWVEFDPTTLTDVAGGATSSIDDLDAMTEFGMFYADSRSNSYIDGFEAYAAVPEPVTVSMLALGGGLGLLRRRRR